MEEIKKGPESGNKRAVRFYFHKGRPVFVFQDGVTEEWDPGSTIWQVAITNRGRGTLRLDNNKVMFKKEGAHTEDVLTPGSDQILYIDLL